MKRILAALFAIVFCMTGCSSDYNTDEKPMVSEKIENSSINDHQKEITTISESDSKFQITEVTDYSSVKERANSIQAQNLNFLSLNDDNLLKYVEDNVYNNVVEGLDSEKYFVENVEAIYISKEYLDELSYNSQENVYFGYKLSDITAQWGDTKYIFTVDENGQTTVQAFEEYDDTYDKVIRNVAIGTGVILVCVTVSVVTAGTGTAPAISTIFAASAKTGTAMALSSGVLGGAATAITCGIEGKSLDETLKESALSASEGFMWGAIGGAISGGATEAIALKGATASGLTMNEVALIQKESNYPLDVIKGFKTIEQYKICRDAGLFKCEVNGRNSLIRMITLDFEDKAGRTNLQRMKEGLAALDPNTGEPYQLHHIGQEMDSTLAILTEEEHMLGGNNMIWHNLEKESTIDRNAFDVQRKKYWMTMAEIMANDA